MSFLAKINKMNNLILKILILVSTFNQFSCDLVTIRATDNDNTKSYTEVCSLFRGPSTYLSKYNHPLLVLNATFDACNANNESFVETPQNAVYFKINENLDCEFEFVENTLDNANVLSIIGLKNSLVLKLSNSSIIKIHKIPFLFLPNELSDQLDRFLEGSNSTNIELVKKKSPFDVSIVIVTSIGLLTLVLGAFWHRHKFIKDVSNTPRSSLGRKYQTKNTTAESSSKPSEPNESKFLDNDDKQSITHRIQQKLKAIKRNKFFLPIVMVVVAVVLAGVVVLVNIAFTVMEVVLSVVFVLMATCSMSRIGNHIMGRINLLTCQVPSNKITKKIYFNRTMPQWRTQIFLLICTIFSIVWFSTRHMLDWSWILQDIMAVAITLNILSFSIFRAYKWCFLTILVFFFYDVFMIFFLPLITDENKVSKSLCFGMQASIYSVHEKSENYETIHFNADQGDGNALPFYFIIPNILTSTKLCNELFDFPFTMLGMGEILIPAISLNYALIHDLSNVGKKIPIYFIANLIGIILGYFCVCLILSLVYINQPPLVWVLPFNLFISIAISMYKKEFDEYWHGLNIKKYVETNSK